MGVVPTAAGPRNGADGKQYVRSSFGFKSGLSLLLWLWFATLLVVNLPGHLSFDSSIQILEGATGEAKSWNPPFASLVFGRLASLTGGTEIIVVLHGLLLIASLRLILAESPHAQRWALIPCAAMLYAPVLLVYPGIVWKDVLFAHLCLFAFALAQLRLRAGFAWVDTVALFVLASAMLCRQTGLVAVLPCVAALAVASVARQDEPHRWDRSLFVSVLGRFTLRLIALALIAFGLNLLTQTFVRQNSSEPVATGIRLVAVFDISGMLARSPDSTLALLRSNGINTTKVEAAARNSFAAERIDFLAGEVRDQFFQIDRRMLLAQWLELVLRSPFTYAAHRLDSFAWLSGLREQSRCLPIHVGIEPQETARAAGIVTTPSRFAGVLYDYSRFFWETPYFAPITWFLVAFGVFCVYGLQRSWLEPVALLQLAALIYFLLYLIAGLACDFRYAYFTVLASSAGLMRLCVDAPGLIGASRRVGPKPER